MQLFQEEVHDILTSEIEEKEEPPRPLQNIENDEVQLSQEEISDVLTSNMEETDPTAPSEVAIMNKSMFAKLK